MEAAVRVKLAQSSSKSPPCVFAHQDGRRVEFRPPEWAQNSGLPAQEVAVEVDAVSDWDGAASHFQGELAGVVDGFLNGSRNTVIYTYGQRGTPKRDFFFGEAKSFSEKVGSKAGLIQHFAHQLFKDGVDGRWKIEMCGLAVGNEERVTDLLDAENANATLADSVKDGPMVSNLTRSLVSDYPTAAGLLKQGAQNIRQEFDSVWSDSLELPDDSFKPPYDPRHIVFSILKSDAEADDQEAERNSLTFVVLGDSERPGLCGFDVKELRLYESTHKTLSAVLGVLLAIRGNRLRVPFTKSKLTSVMKRPYNQEKHNPYNDENNPTQSFFYGFVFAEAEFAEESYHTLVMLQRMIGAKPCGGIGAASRDLNCEKWRLEQDIKELKEELSVAGKAHDYQPCIHRPESSKQVANIHEEETKRVSAITKRREEAQRKIKEEMRAKAMEKAQAAIAKEEAKSGANISEIDHQMELYSKENAALEETKKKKVKDLDKQLEKIRKKRVEEEDTTAKLKEQVKEIEREHKRILDNKEATQRELEDMERAHSSGRDVAEKFKEEIKSKRNKQARDHRIERETWIQGVKEQSHEVSTKLEAVRSEESVMPCPMLDDLLPPPINIAADLRYLRIMMSEIINNDDPRQGANIMKMRAQVEEKITKLIPDYQRATEIESARADHLDERAKQFQAEINDHKRKLKKLNIDEALQKRDHLEKLVDKVVKFLEHGCRMIKIPTKGTPRRRFFFVAEDHKSLRSCEIDDRGMPINQKRPTTTVCFKDIRRVILGQYSTTFIQFAQKDKVKPCPDDALQSGDYTSSEQTEVKRPSDLGRFFYRSLTFELKKGKTLDVIAESDSDFEAWVVALQRIGDAERLSIDWGQPLDLANRQGSSELSQEEANFCANHHIQPQQYITVRSAVQSKDRAGQFVTVYDIRIVTCLDLPRSFNIHRFFVKKGMISTIPD